MAVLTWRVFILSELNIYTRRRVVLMAAIGFASGLPLALTNSALQAWATEAGVSLKSIGWLTLVGTAYTLKFLWAPLVDRYAPPLLGRRRGWMLLTQLALAVSIAAMGWFSPAETLLPLAVLAVMVAFLSATQDIACDAYTADVLHKEERGAGVALKTLGYRIAMIVSSGFALIIADRWLGWGNTYVLMGILMLFGAFATLCAPEPEEQVCAPQSLAAAVVAPLQDFFSRPGAVSLLILIVLYKLGDAFALTLSTSFLLRGGGFTLTEVGVVNKGLGVTATVVGALLGGGLIVRLGLYRALMTFGVLQAISNLGYWLIALMPGNMPILVLAIGVENLCSGLGNAAFGVFLISLCHAQFSATQFALLSALAVIGRVWAGPAASALVVSFGWSTFFLMTVAIAIPGLIFLFMRRHEIKALDAR